MKIRTDADYSLISRNMMKYGGSFFKSLGVALMHADDTNKQKLANTFARDFTRYEKFQEQ